MIGPVGKFVKYAIKKPEIKINKATSTDIRIIIGSLLNRGNTICGGIVNKANTKIIPTERIIRTTAMDIKR
jgi:hypothetical protein